MIPIDPALLDIIKRSHPIGGYMDIYSGRSIVQQNVKISGGSVTADRGQRARRQFTGEVVIPTGGSLPLSLETTRLQVWLRYAVGSPTINVPVGVFRLDSMARGTRSALSLSGSSLESYVIEDTCVKSRTIAAGTAVLEAIKQLVWDSLPDAEFEYTAYAAGISTKIPYAVTLDVGASPWDLIDTLAFFAGADVYCSPQGRFRIEKRPTLFGSNIAPVAALQTGKDGSIINTTVSMARDKMYNAVLAQGQSTTTGVAPVSFHAKYENETAAMRWGGPFGQKTKILPGDKLLTTKALCMSKAFEELLNAVSVSRTIDVTATPNPALEPDDIVAITMPDNTVETHMIKTLSIPLVYNGDWSCSTLSLKETDSLNPAASIQPESTTT